MCRCGTLHISNGVCALVTKKDLEYWGIDELLLEPCCALKFYPEIELCVKEVEGEELFLFSVGETNLAATKAIQQAADGVQRIFTLFSC